MGGGGGEGAKNPMPLGLRSATNFSLNKLVNFEGSYNYQKHQNFAFLFNE